MADRQMTLFLAEDKLIVQEAVPALISLQPDLAVVGAAADDYGGLRGEYCAAQVFVTDIRMPPTSQQEGTDAANEGGKGHPGIGAAVVLATTMAAPPAPGAPELRPAHLVRAE